jgi:hypothetical protein
VIACVVEKYAEFAEDLIRPITELALRGLGCGDEFIAAVANDLVSELASWAAPCVSARFDTFLLGLLPHLHSFVFMQTLQRVLEASDHASVHLPAVFECLVALLASLESPCDLVTA